VTVERGAGAGERHTVGHWLALLGGHVGWSAQLLIGYALAESACRPGLGAAEIAILAATGLALLLTLAAGRAGLALARRSGDRPADRRDRFLGGVTLFLNGLFLFAVAMAGLALAALGACA
jgi:hypothetical protein